MKLKTKRIIAFFKLQHQGITWVSPRLDCSPTQRFHSDKTVTNAQKHNKNIRIFVCSIARKILFQLPIQVLRCPVNSVADLRQNASKIPVTQSLKSLSCIDRMNREKTNTTRNALTKDSQNVGESINKAPLQNTYNFDGYFRIPKEMQSQECQTKQTSNISTRKCPGCGYKLQLMDSTDSIIFLP